jgi:3-oxoacyl-[acyl-carrier protein] reductase
MTTARELDGKVAILTGSAQNIGRAMALTLAEGGAKIVVNTRASMDLAEGVAKEIRDAGGEAVAVQGDVTKEADVLNLVAQAVKAFGKVDILVNNAAVRLRSPLTEMSFEEWRKVVAIILDGAFLCARAVAPHMIAQKSGTIISMGGLTAHAGAAERCHVTAAKAGIVGLTKGLAHELAPHGITANCVVPGLIDTTRDGNSAVPHAHGHLASIVGRQGRPHEVAGMVRHLCGPHARYVTGQTIHVNGGAYLP